ncbi:MAG: hypothetical protein ACRC8D_07305 [Aeromonas sp.]
MNKALDEALELWARWCHTGQTLPAGKSIMQRLMECKGHFNFGSGGAQGPQRNIEEKIEAAMMKLAAHDLASADIIRLESASGWINVLKRRKVNIRQFNYKDSRQADRASVMGISDRTYRTKLQNARAFILGSIIE